MDDDVANIIRQALPPQEAVEAGGPQRGGAGVHHDTSHHAGVRPASHPPKGQPRALRPRR